MAINQKLEQIQHNLKAPKGQTNSFGGYKYRSCEDILEAVKPLLDGVTLLLSDEVVCVGVSNYVKATATLTDGEAQIEVSAFAREAVDKKGMDDAQITGAASSYARKYALNGLFAIDDTKDADTRDNSSKPPVKTTTKSGMTPNKLLELGKLLEGKGITKKEDKVKIFQALAMDSNFMTLDEAGVADLRKQIILAPSDTLKGMLEFSDAN